MRRTPVPGDPDDQHDDAQLLDASATSDAATRPADAPPARRVGRRGNPRYWRGGPQSPPPRRRPLSPLAWLLPGAVGIAALAAIWLGLQWLFPAPAAAPADPASPAEVPTPAVVGATDPPSALAPPPPAATPLVEPTSPAGDRLPGLTAGAPPVPAPTSDPAPGPSDPAAPAPAQDAAPTPAPAEAGAAAPSEAAAPPAEGAAPSTPDAAPPAEAPAEAAEPPAEPAAQAAAPLSPREPAPVPPREPAPAGAAPARAAAPPPRPPAQAAPAQSAPAPRAAAPAAPPAAPARGNAGLRLQASASPTNPVSERAFVTITARMTNNGAPVAGAVCMATVTFRTATVRQPEGGARTGPNGVATFVVDGQGATYNVFVPVDVTCTSAAGSASARTGFTPTRAR